MNKIALFIIFLMLCNIAAASAEEKSGDGLCISCHGKDTPLVVKSWSESAHAKNGIECGECHEGDYDIGHLTGEDRIIVEAYVCARCHAAVSKGHFSGKHGIGFRAGRACTRNMNKTPEILAGCNDCHEKGSRLPRQEVECSMFLAQSPEMQRQGCLSCHKVENRCDACHSSHLTDLAIARDPAVCATCHMGPDHPQYEMWLTSRHGIMFNLKGRDYSPDCATCHMPEGNHDVSIGITMGLGGQEYPQNVRESQRAKMLAICSNCHTKSFSMRSLEDGDAIQLQAKEIVGEAASIIKGLEKDGLLFPSPAVRPGHPLSGNKLEIGPQMLYEDLSKVEAVFFRMKKFYYVITYKGVFHQNPDYAHWYGNAPLKLALSEIKSEAALLRELKSLKERVDNLSTFEKTGTDNNHQSQADTLRTNLGHLRELHLRGDLSDEEFRKRKNDLLDRHGL